MPLQALVLEANPHAAPQPHLKRVLLKGVADPGTRRLLVQQGDVDVAYQLGPDQIAALKSDANVRIDAFPSSLVYYLGFNTKNAQQPALGNPALWQAARWLVDYDSLANQLLKGQYRIHQSFLPDGFDGALNTTPFHYDVSKAKAILKDGGIAPGTHIALTVVNQPPYIDVAQALQASFAKADVNLDIQPVAESELWSKMRGRDFQSIFIYWGADYIDPNTNASAFAYNVPGGSKTLAWRVGWDIPALSAETRKAAGESDAAQRRALYTHLQTEVQQSRRSSLFCRARSRWRCAKTSATLSRASASACCCWTRCKNNACGARASSSAPASTALISHSRFSVILSLSPAALAILHTMSFVRE